MVNTISIDHVDHVVCMIDDDKPKQKRYNNEEPEQKSKKNDEKSKKKRYFIVKPVSTLCSIRLKEWNNMSLEKIKITYLPLNSSISTTGHKLQGQSLEHLVVNSWAYKCPLWVYVVLSQVKTLNGLILNQKLDEIRSYAANNELIRWERNVKTNIEYRTFMDSGELYLKEEADFNDLFNNMGQQEKFENANTDNKSRMMNCYNAKSNDGYNTTKILNKNYKNEKLDHKTRDDTILQFMKESNFSPKIVTQDYSQKSTTCTTVNRNTSITLSSHMW